MHSVVSMSLSAARGTRNLSGWRCKGSAVLQAAAFARKWLQRPGKHPEAVVPVGEVSASRVTPNTIKMCYQKPEVSPDPLVSRPDLKDTGSFGSQPSLSHLASSQANSDKPPSPGATSAPARPLLDPGSARPDGPLCPRLSQPCPLCIHLTTCTPSMSLGLFYSMLCVSVVSHFPA